jgi:small subunit ribosomal protein S8
MAMTDPIADLLTRVRNANMVKHASVDVPASNMKQGIIRIEMKYGEDKERVITGLKRISKPGLRVYAKRTDIPKVLGGLGIAIISTSNGIVTDKEARKLGVGGEVICYVW